MKWGIDRNLIGSIGEATRLSQYRKTHEEVGELLEAIELENVELAKDAIGDIYVTLVLQAHMWGLTMDECIEAAWNEIKDRKGKMVDGIFVKREQALDKLTEVGQEMGDYDVETQAKDLCNYPDCKCPFDMDSYGKCFQGLTNTSEQDNSAINNNKE